MMNLRGWKSDVFNMKRIINRSKILKFEYKLITSLMNKCEKSNLNF